MSQDAAEPYRRTRVRNILYPPALRFRDFRFLWLASICNSVGFVGEQVALGWLTLELTGSTFMVGVALALRMVPFFLLGVLAGAVADRVDRRFLLSLTSLVMAGLSAALGAIIWLEWVATWHLLAFAFAGGCVRAMHHPARQSFAFDIVGPGNLVSGLSYMSLGMRIGGIVGSLAVGVLLGRFGAELAYMALTVSYLASAATLQLIQSGGQSAPTSRLSVVQNLREMAGELRSNRGLMMLLVLAAAVEIVGFSHQTLLPTLARDVLKVGPEGLGLMNALRSVGGIVAILFLSSVGETRRKGAMYLAALHIFGLSLVLLGVASTFWVAVLAIVVANGMGALSDVLSQSLVQSLVPNEFRGRAMGTWVLAVGMGPLGHLQIGALASVFTLTFALVTHGVGLLALAAGSVLLFPRLRKL